MEYRLTDVLTMREYTRSDPTHAEIDAGSARFRPMTCGTCGRTWDDARITDRTPVPAARCPFEYEHEEEEEEEEIAGTVGERVTYAGYPGTITSVYPSPHPAGRGMAEVQLASGPTVVSVSGRRSLT